MNDGICVGCGSETLGMIQCDCTQEICACEVCCESGVPLVCDTCRDRAVGCRSSRGLSVPGLCGRRRRRDGLGGTVAGDGARRHLGTAVSRLVLNCNAAGRFTPSQQRFVAPSGAFLPGAPKAPSGGVQPHRIGGAAKRRCRRPAATPCDYVAQASSLPRS